MPKKFIQIAADGSIIENSYFIAVNDTGEVDEQLPLLPTMPVEEIGITVRLNNSDKGYFWETIQN